MKKLLVPALLVALGGLARGHGGDEAHNRNDAAIQECTDALADNPDQLDALRKRGLLYLAQNEYESALGDFEHLVRLKPEWEPYRVARAVANVRLGDWKAAAADLDPLCSAATTNGGAWFTRGELRFLAGDARGAVSDLDRAFAIIKPRSFLRGLVFRARAKAALGDVNGALEDWKAAKEMDPSAVDVLVGHASLVAANDWASAKADLERLKETHPTDPRTLAAEARLLYERNGLGSDIEAKALQAFDRDQKAARSPARKAELLLEAASLRAGMGELWPAVDLVQDALELAPDRVDAHRLRVRLLERARGTKPETLAGARRKLAAVEAAHGLAPVTSTSR